MKRERGLCGATWTFSRSTSRAVSRPSSTSVRSIARSSAISSAAGLPLPATSPSASTSRPSGSGQDVVEIAADGVGRARHAADGRVAGVSHAARQHRQLDVARDLEVALERQPIRDLHQDQQVDGDEADEQPQRAVHPRRQRHVRPSNGKSRTFTGREAAEQHQHAEQRRGDREPVERAPRRRQAHREAGEHQPRRDRPAAVPRQAAELLEVERRG